MPRQKDGTCCLSAGSTYYDQQQILYIHSLVQLYSLKAFAGMSLLPSSCRGIVLADRPRDHIKPDTFKSEESSTPAQDSLKDSEVLFQSNYLSLDRT